MSEARDVRDHVRERYAEAAKQAAAGKSSCCGPSPLSVCDPITKNLYSESETGELPEEAVRASLGCGNPTALAELRPGEVVLDLGSGGGIDVILSARRVGPTGKAYGLDMTDEMLALAEENRKKAGVANVELLKGTIEDIPLPDASVDVIISNCVINLSGDKDRVLREGFRVLKPGGRFAISDVVLRRELPDVLRRSLELWAGCVAGALTEREYRDKLAAAGFEAIDVEATREYRIEEFRDMLTEAGLEGELDALRGHDGAMVSAFVRATKPAAASVWSDAVSALVGVGAAIGSNCGPCFEFHAKRARGLGVPDDDLRRAVAIARKVKEAPAKAVLDLAERTLAGADAAESGASTACCPPRDEPKAETGSRCC